MPTLEPSQGQAQQRALRDRRALIQKVKGVSARVFASDYLCQGPRAHGIWFTQYDEAVNLTPEAEFDPAAPVHIAIDSGVFTGAVFFQVKSAARGDGANWHREQQVNVFADYLAEGQTAESCALAIGAQSSLSFADRPAGRSRPIRPEGHETPSAPRSSPSTSGAASPVKGAFSSGPSTQAASTTASG